MRPHLVSGQVTEEKRAVAGHRLDQRGVEELTKLGHQAAPLVVPGVVAEEAVQGGVEGVGYLHLGAQRVDDVVTGRGFRVVDGCGQRTDTAPVQG